MLFRSIHRQVAIGLGQSQVIEVTVSAELSAAETMVIVEEHRHLDADRLSPGALLTAEGQALMRDAECTARNLEDEATGQLSTAERKTLIRLLRKVYLPPATAAPPPPTDKALQPGKL